MSRLLRLAAFFRWITPASAARSNCWIASMTEVAARSGFPASIAVRASLTWVRARVRTGLFRSRRFSFCRIRFFAERVFAKSIP